MKRGQLGSANTEPNAFCPILNFGHFGPSSLAFDLPQCNEPWRQEELPGNEEQKKTKKTTQDKQKENNKERHWGRDKQYSPCFLVETSLAEGKRRFRKSTADARSGVQVFTCLGVQSLFFRCKAYCSGV